MKRLVIRVLGKEFLSIQLGEPANLAPDFTSHPVGFTIPAMPEEIDLPKRGEE